MDRYSQAGLLELLDRLRRQALDVLLPLLATVSLTGAIEGIQWGGLLTALTFGSLATVVMWFRDAESTIWWQRLITTVAAAFVTVAGSDWQGWVHLDARAVAIAVAAAVASSLLRSTTKGARIGRDSSR